MFGGEDIVFMGKDGRECRSDTTSLEPEVKRDWSLLRPALLARYPPPDGDEDDVQLGGSSIPQVLAPVGPQGPRHNARYYFPCIRDANIILVSEATASLKCWVYSGIIQLRRRQLAVQTLQILHLSNMEDSIDPASFNGLAQVTHGYGRSWLMVLSVRIWKGTVLVTPYKSFHNKLLSIQDVQYMLPLKPAAL